MPHEYCAQRPRPSPGASSLFPKQWKSHSVHLPSLQSYLSSSVRDGHQSDLLLEAELLLLSFATGIQDATTYPDYQCFASNQTGNTVLFAVGVAGLGGSLFSLRTVGVSLGTFIAGCYLMGQIGNLCGPRKRLWLLITNAVQTALVFAAVGIQWSVRSSGSDSIAMVVITLLAVSSGAQVAMARPLNIPQITTAMATAAYVDLLVDPHLHSLHNRHRNRRLCFLLMLAAGSFVGAFAHSRVNSAFALLLSAVGKSIVTVLFFFNASDECMGADSWMTTRNYNRGSNEEQAQTEASSMS
ncbi:hypothetical protein K432DRAFT_337810 [Lepidopterella palustris CBS 459.81]|uniref:DUF1275 domain protein n=1 Tax=Lepidopterella palustris CBS 459.81 TaxID=1314670 RepID=A0A8E2E101_9PEZI|nr:hypothetical protein K432DRAFT_337810 [Lepidopterella palustris CBS 459.81]